MVHKFRATASNIYHSSVKGKGAMVMAKDTKKKQVACCPTYSDFFEHFVKGLHKRMGNIVRPDWAISHEIVKNVLDTMEEEWETESVHSRRLELALEGAYYVLGLTLALRGEELTLVEMRGVRKYWEEATQHKTPHIVITLMGRLKNEICESYHLMPVMRLSEWPGPTSYLRTPKSKRNMVYQDPFREVARHLQPTIGPPCGHRVKWTLEKEVSERPLLP